MAAKKPSPAKSKKPAPVTKTETKVRNTALPKVTKTAAAPIQLTHDMVAKRAFEIACGGTGGSEQDNWYRAERELKAGL